METTFEKVRAIICEQLSIEGEKITLETSLLTDIGADSLDLFQIISNLEEEYELEFPAEVATQMKTVGDAIEYINANKK